ncbi:hypothetical protein OBBRIDRAFT_805984 [Obba rivulosa]|uniref:Uncharacterized protein n=1 Tax=Obba rivulosa TaxID=1052685 RepID=A0A8E2AY38_9APHY|nr:hypothetical protein OBBRIDRAFT_805984 [Obba rivulosa]
MRSSTILISITVIAAAGLTLATPAAGSVGHIHARHNLGLRALLWDRAIGIGPIMSNIAGFLSRRDEQMKRGTQWTLSTRFRHHILSTVLGFPFCRAEDILCAPGIDKSCARHQGSGDPEAQFDALHYTRRSATLDAASAVISLSTIRSFLNCASDIFNVVGNLFGSDDSSQQRGSLPARLTMATGMMLPQGLTPNEALNVLGKIFGGLPNDVEGLIPGSAAPPPSRSSSSCSAARQAVQDPSAAISLGCNFRHPVASGIGSDTFDGNGGLFGATMCRVPGPWRGARA